MSSTALDGAERFEDRERVRRRIAEQLAFVARTIPVVSGKGGVGKSAVAVNLALALAARGSRVGLLDGDLQGPSVAKMLGLRGQPVRATSAGLRPVPGPAGLAVQSMDFFLQGAQPLDWDGSDAEACAMRSALEESALADLLGRTEWGELDALVIDLAPGADRLPVLAHLLRRITGALVVTIPTEVALLAVERSIRRAHALRIPLIGLVENMGSIACAACGAETQLFRESPLELAARDLDAPLIARIPFEPRLAGAGDAGRSFLDDEGRDTPAGRAFDELAARVLAFESPEEGS